MKSLYERWIRASEKLEGSSERARAELLTSLLIFRSVILFSLLVYMPLAVVGSNKTTNGILVGALGLNIVGYGISRTRYFRYGAILIMLEALFAVPVSVMNIMTPDAISSGPIWLGLNNIIASLVLPFSWTVVSILVTIIPFWIIATHVPSSYLTIVSGEFVYTMLSSTLALLGTYLRDKSDQTLQEERAKLQQISKLSALGEMAGGVAHEINNPLTGIKNVISQMSELLDEESIDRATLKEMANTVEKTTDRIAKIVRGLRSFSRDGSHDPYQVVNLKQLINETLAFCSERFKSHGIHLTVEDFQNEIAFEGNSVQISQVLLNLLNNAHDAVIHLQEKWVNLSVIDQSEWVEIIVTDSGKGIPSEIHKKIFQPFFTTKEIGKGTGMGLSIALGIIQAHRGELDIDTRCANTRFSARLPKKQKTKAST